MATGDRKDPISAFRFMVEIGGVSRGIFTEVSGLDSTIDVTEHGTGGGNGILLKLPGITKYSNLVLKWGITDDMSLYQWHRQAALGEVKRENGSILALNHLGKEIARWNFTNAWPTKYTGPTFNGESSEVAIETMELAHEGIERVS
jgi:phage tail-like protein